MKIRFFNNRKHKRPGFNNLLHFEGGIMPLSVYQNYFYAGIFGFFLFFHYNKRPLYK